MKIEKISDNQIRFTLTGEDLAARQIKLSELAYGTEKARNLFREMMQQAASQVGFEADNIPLMIEAIPMSEGSIVLVVTKVENPEELDTRFSGFAPSLTASEGISFCIPSQVPDPKEARTPYRLCLPPLPLPRRLRMLLKNFVFMPHATVCIPLTAWTAC